MTRKKNIFHKAKQNQRFNPFALRKAKTQRVLAVLSAIELNPYVKAQGEWMSLITGHVLDFENSLCN